MALEHEIKLGDMVGTMRRWRWVIAGTVLIGGTAAGIWSLLQAPVYKAVAAVVVEREEQASLERVGSYFLIPEYYQTHFELLKSPGIIEEAARRVSLPQRPEYRRKPPSAFKQLVQNAVPSLLKEALQDGCRVNVTIPKDGEEPNIDRCLLKSFEENIDVKGVRGTRLAHISVQSVDPQFGAQAANALAMAYIDGRMAMTARGREKAADWYSHQLDRLRKKVEEAEYQLYAYRVKHGLVDARDGQRDVAQKLGELNSELLKAEMKAAEAQSRYQHISSVVNRQDRDPAIDWKFIDSSSEVLSSTLIQSLRGQEIKASGQIAELMDKYGPLHPKLAHAKSELSELRERIQGEVEKIYRSLKQEYDVAQARVRVIQEAVNRQKQAKTKLEQNEIEYGILDREAKSTRQLYEMFLKQMKDRELSPEMTDTPVYLADPAVPPAQPIKPRKKLNVLLGMIAGLMSGVGIALFAESRDRRLKSPEDAERYLPSVPVLSVVPRLAKHDLGPLRITETNGGRQAAESFKALRTTLLLSMQHHRPRSILVTSAGDSEGKTTVAVNLATTLAQLEHVRVVLINGDLRKANFHPLFHVETSNGAPLGLSHYLSGRAQIDDVIYPTLFPNVFVIPQGAVPTNPSELIHSEAMMMLLKRCHEKGWHIIVDSPPVLSVAEALILSTMVDGVLMVVSAQEGSRESSQSALQRLSGNGARVLGLVIQKAAVRKLPYYAVYGHRPELPHYSTPSV